MGPLANVPVGDGELLARFVFSPREVRADKTMRPEAFLPYKWVELSVTRHRDLDEDGLWSLGREVAVLRQKPLVGRADFTAQLCRDTKLDVIPAEGPGIGGLNHANIVGWPSEKSAQMAHAQTLAEAATFVDVINS